VLSRRYCYTLNTRQSLVLSHALRVFEEKAVSKSSYLTGTAKF
jgi:hypothetical protein